MRTVFFILTLSVLFIIGYAIFFFAIEWYIKWVHKKNVDRKIKETLFQELGFIYRETYSGDGYLIIDEYKDSKAIKV